MRFTNLVVLALGAPAVSAFVAPSTTRSHLSVGSHVSWVSRSRTQLRMAAGGKSSIASAEADLKRILKEIEDEKVAAAKAKRDTEKKIAEEERALANKQQKIETLQEGGGLASGAGTILAAPVLLGGAIVAGRTALAEREKVQKEEIAAAEAALLEAERAVVKARREGGNILAPLAVYGVAAGIVFASLTGVGFSPVSLLSTTDTAVKEEVVGQNAGASNAAESGSVENLKRDIEDDAAAVAAAEKEAEEKIAGLVADLNKVMAEDEKRIDQLKKEAEEAERNLNKMIAEDQKKVEQAKKEAAEAEKEFESLRRKAEVTPVAPPVEKAEEPKPATETLMEKIFTSPPAEEAEKPAEPAPLEELFQPTSPPTEKPDVPDPDPAPPAPAPITPPVTKVFEPPKPAEEPPKPAADLPKPAPVPAQPPAPAPATSTQVAPVVKQPKDTVNPDTIATLFAAGLASVGIAVVFASGVLTEVLNENEAVSGTTEKPAPSTAPATEPAKAASAPPPPAPANVSTPGVASDAMKFALREAEAARDSAVQSKDIALKVATEALDEAETALRTAVELTAPGASDSDIDSAPERVEGGSGTGTGSYLDAIGSGSAPSPENPAPSRQKSGGVPGSYLDNL